MPKQFENPEATKLEEETLSNTSAQERIDRVAEKAAQRPAKTEQHFDKDNSDLFSK